MADYSKVKPRPDAIPTIYGWALPSGEVLVSIKGGCAEPVLDFHPNRPWVEPIIEEPFIDNTSEPIDTVISQGVIEEYIAEVVVTEPIVIKEPVVEISIVEATPVVVTPKPETFKLPKNIKSGVKN